MFFTAVNPMDEGQSMEEIRYGLDTQRITPYENTWRPHRGSVLVQLKAPSEDEVVRYNTLPAI